MKIKRYTATFETWKLPHDQKLPGKFYIVIELKPMRGSFRWKPAVGATMQEFQEDFAERDIDACKAFVEKQFERMALPWVAN